MSMPLCNIRLGIRCTKLNAATDRKCNRKCVNSNEWSTGAGERVNLIFRSRSPSSQGSPRSGEKCIYSFDKILGRFVSVDIVI